MNHTLSDSQVESMIKSAVNSSGPLPPDEKFSQLVSALRELQERRKADSEPMEWLNGCNKSVPAALRYLAENPRPIGGESLFNTAHLYQLAREIECMASVSLYRHAQPAPVVQCPFPCGWDSLNGLAIQDAAFVALALVAGEPATESVRQAAISNNDRLLKVISACRATMLAAAPQEVK
ncbi:hypothetical protein D9D10_03645 [Raoultella ornithinolytica]|nr:hypothetical protein D9D10_03645 [Raoultella ornithinolytica]